MSLTCKITVSYKAEFIASESKAWLPITDEKKERNIMNLCNACSLDTELCMQHINKILQLTKIEFDQPPSAKGLSVGQQRGHADRISSRFNAFTIMPGK